MNEGGRESRENNGKCHDACWSHDCQVMAGQLVARLSHDRPRTHLTAFSEFPRIRRLEMGSLILTPRSSIEDDILFST